jgi:hypothetical protein
MYILCELIEVLCNLEEPSLEVYHTRFRRLRDTSGLRDNSTWALHGLQT